jgi:3-isopropylmalate dehydrogenase
MTLKNLALGGDGIGPEVVDSALQVLEVAAADAGHALDISEDLLHGAAWEKYGVIIRPETLAKAHQSDALLVGATGGPQWDHLVIEGGPEDQDGLMKLRHELQVFACLRHAKTYDALVDRTSFKPDIVRGADIMVMRELCGGAMFTSTRGIDEVEGGRRAYDLNEYTEAEIVRFARVGFEVARRRRQPSGDHGPSARDSQSRHHHASGQEGRLFEKDSPYGRGNVGSQVAAQGTKR